MRKLGANQPVHPLAQLVNIEGRLTQRLALRGYQPIDQAGQAIGLGNDDLRVLVQIIRTQLHVQQLRGPTYPTQRIFDLVGEIAQGLRSKERRGGQERVSTSRSRWSPYT